MEIGLRASASRIYSKQKSQLIKTIISLIIIILTIYLIVRMGLLRGKLQFDFILAIELCIIISLSFNIFFAIFHDFTLLYLQILFANYYLVSLFCYIGYNISFPFYWLRIVFNIMVSIFILVYTGIFIFRQITSRSGCEQIWVLIVNGIGIVISVVIFAIFFYQYRKEIQYFKISKKESIISWQSQKLNYSSQIDKINEQTNQNSLLSTERIQSSDDATLLDDMLNNPFPSMWAMIIINILCSIVAFSESIVYVVNQSCSLLFKNQTLETIISLLIDIFSYFIGFLAALYCINKKNQMKIQFKKQPLQSETQNLEEGRGKLQLVYRDSIRTSQINSLLN